MIKLFRKTPIDKLKKLSLLPTQYNHEDLTPLEITMQEKEKFNIKKKSYGYFVDNYFYNKIEISNDDSLCIETNILTEKDCEKLINLFFKELGVCNKEKGYFDSEDLINLKRKTTAKVRNWEIEHENATYHVMVSNYSEGINFILNIDVDIWCFQP